MKTKPILLGTLAYTLATFPLAVIWHVVLFKEMYHAFGYFEGEPVIALGFLAIVIQGAVLSSMYPYVSLGGKGIARGIKYSLITGLFFWTSHVLAFVAKNLITNPASFVVVESIYLLIQFLIYGILIGLIYSKHMENDA